MTTTPDINPTHTIGRASIESQELYKFLQKAETGQIITYQEMSEAAKIDVQAHAHVIQTARRMLIRTDRVGFGTVRGIGLKRLSDEEIPDESASGIKRARNIAKKSMKLIDCAKYDKLSPEAKIRHTTTKIILGLMQSSGSRKTLNLAEQGARVSNGDMKIGDVAALFSK